MRLIDRAVNIHPELANQIYAVCLEIYGIHLNHQQYVLSIFSYIGLKAQFCLSNIPKGLIFVIYFIS